MNLLIGLIVGALAYLILQLLNVPFVIALLLGILIGLVVAFGWDGNVGWPRR